VDNAQVIILIRKSEENGCIVFDIVKCYLTQDISDEELEAKATAIAHQVGLDLDSIYDPEPETFNEPHIM
jgi:hypothetical protein